MWARKVCVCVPWCCVILSDLYCVFLRFYVILDFYVIWWCQCKVCPAPLLHSYIAPGKLESPRRPLRGFPGFSESWSWAVKGWHHYNHYKTTKEVEKDCRFSASCMLSNAIRRKKSQEYNSITKIVLERLTFWEELCMKSNTGLHKVGCTSSTILATLPDSWAGFELQRMAVLALATFLLDLRKWKDPWVH